jgi:hypothetical protein
MRLSVVVVIIRQNLITFFDLGILDFGFSDQQAIVEMSRIVSLIVFSPHPYVAVDILGKNKTKKLLYKRRVPL